MTVRKLYDHPFVYRRVTLANEPIATSGNVNAPPRLRHTRMTRHRGEVCDSSVRSEIIRMASPYFVRAVVTIVCLTCRRPLNPSHNALKITRERVFFPFFEEFI